MGGGTILKARKFGSTLKRKVMGELEGQICGTMKTFLEGLSLIQTPGVSCPLFFFYCRCFCFFHIMVTGNPEPGSLSRGDWWTRDWF